MKQFIGTIFGGADDGKVLRASTLEIRYVVEIRYAEMADTDHVQREFTYRFIPQCFGHADGTRHGVWYPVAVRVIETMQ